MSPLESSTGGSAGVGAQTGGVAGFTPAKGGSAVTPGAFVALTLPAGVAAGAVAPSVRVDDPGFTVARLRGVLRAKAGSGTLAIGATLFTLPVGYRPFNEVRLTVSFSLDKSKTVVMTITTAGVATLNGELAEASGEVALNGLTYAIA